MENKITNKESGTLTALKAKKYRLFWTASIASVGATQLLTLTAGKLVFDLSGSEFLLGLAAAVFGIGTIVINFLVDHIDKVLQRWWECPFSIQFFHHQVQLILHSKNYRHAIHPS